MSNQNHIGVLVCQLVQHRQVKPKGPCSMLNYLTVSNDVQLCCLHFTGLASTYNLIDLWKYLSSVNVTMKQLTMVKS